MTAPRILWRLLLYTPHNLDGVDITTLDFNKYFGGHVWIQKPFGDSQYFLNKIEYYGEKNDLLIDETYEKLIILGEWVGKITTINWYLLDDTIGATKVLVYNWSNNPYKLRTYKKIVRANQFLTMLDKSRRNDNIDNVDIDTLISHYDEEYRHWIREGGVYLTEAVNSEMKPQINIILEKFVDIEETSTIKQSINIITA